MKLKWILIALACAALLFLVWLFKSFFVVDGDTHGFYLVDGEKGRELLISLRDSSDPDDQISGEGKRLEALNRTHNELIYEDPAKRRWIVPKGTVNDGASVPPLLESIVAGGLNTHARYAAIVHDHYCDEMKREGSHVEGGYPAIHKMFFHGMRCSKVSPRTAGLMYAAVAKFGPPSDRSIWAKLVTQALPSESQTASIDKDHALAKWSAEQTILDDNGKAFLLSKNFPEEIRSARLELDEVRIVQSLQAESSSRILQEQARFMNESITLQSTPNGAAFDSRAVSLEGFREISKRMATIELERAKSEDDAITAQKRVTSLEFEFAREKADTEHSVNQAKRELELLENLLKEIPEDEISPESIDQFLSKENG